MSIDIYEQLGQKAQRVNWRTEKRSEYYVLFSRSGFSDELRATTKNASLFLVEGDRLYSTSAG